MVAPVIAYFDYTVDSVTRVIMIYDRDGPRSVTNDAEAVIASLAAVGIRPDDYTIIYLDSEGVWDGVMTEGGRFAGFKLLGARTPEQALLLAGKRATG